MQQADNQQIIPETIVLELAEKVSDIEQKKGSSGSGGSLEESSPDEDLKKNADFETKPGYDGLFKDIPEWQHDNEFVKTGYRVNHKGFRQVAKSVFKWHNETVNIWTHLIGFAMFFSAIIYIFANYNNMYRQGGKAIDDFLKDNKLNDIGLELFTLNKFNFLQSQISEVTDYIESTYN